MWKAIQVEKQITEQCIKYVTLCEKKKGGHIFYFVSACLESKISL